VIGLKRMLHSEQKAEPQNSEHARPDHILTNSILTKGGLVCLMFFAPRPLSRYGRTKHTCSRILRPA
jgi:hypothetical protein